jgi:hypothetical protein
MNSPLTTSIPTALQDRLAVERACIATARDIIREHRFHNQPVITERDGKVVEMHVDEFEAAVNQREAEFNARVAGQ